MTDADGPVRPGPPAAPERPPGRVLSNGRLVARLLLVWLAATVGLALLDRGLTNFQMRSWWQPPVAALILAVLAGFVWPLLIRVTLPVAMVTFGLFGFVAMGAGVLAIFDAIPGVSVATFPTAVGVTMGMAGVAALISTGLALDEDEIFFRRARRRTRDQDVDPTPGVLFLQIDGLGHQTVRRAVRDGTMPTLANWVRSGSHVLEPWHTDWSSQTGAAVCGILHGSNHDILGFRWYEKDRDRVVAVSHPQDAAMVEARHSDGGGLLAGDGASRGNLFSGDAPHRSMTMSSLALVHGRARKRRERLGAGYYAYFANPLNALRTLGVSAVDIVREVVAATRQRRTDVRPRIRRTLLYALIRPGTTVIARDVVVAALIEDMLDGRPVAYADFLGYDEVAHHSGIERPDALAVLGTIDQQIGRLWRATQLAPRPYHLVCLSDHGQTQGWAFVDRFGEKVEDVVGRLCGMPAGQDDTGGSIARRLRARTRRAGALEHTADTDEAKEGHVTRVAPGVVCTVSGHLAMVSFTEIEGRVPIETIERRWPELLPGLVEHDGVGFVLVHSQEFGPVVLGRDGLHRLRTGVVIGEDPLAPYGEHAAALVARVSEFPHCADVMVNSRFDPVTEEASAFEVHAGSHGALGGPQQWGFLVRPASFADPGEVVGAEHLHRVLRGWLTDLGQPDPRAEPSGGAVPADARVAAG